MKLLNLKTSLFEMAAAVHNRIFEPGFTIYVQKIGKNLVKYIYGRKKGSQKYGLYDERGNIQHIGKSGLSPEEMVQQIKRWGFKELEPIKKNTGQKSNYATGEEVEGTLKTFTGKAYHGTPDILFFRSFHTTEGLGLGSHLNSLNGKDAFSITTDFKIAESFTEKEARGNAPGMIVEFNVKNMKVYYASRDEDDLDEIEFPKETDAVAIPHGRFEEKELAVINNSTHKFMTPVAVHLPVGNKWIRYAINGSVEGEEEMEAYLADYLVQLFGKRFGEILGGFWYGKEKYNYASSSVVGMNIGRLGVIFSGKTKPYFFVVSKTKRANAKPYYSAEQYLSDPNRERADKDDQVEDEDEYDESVHSWDQNKK